MLLECAGTRRRHDRHCAVYGPPVDGTLEPARGGGWKTNHYAATLEAAPVQAQDAPRRLDWSRIRQDGVSSVALLATPPHVGKQCGTHVNYSLLSL
jgi:hypothetical protein